MCKRELSKDMIKEMDFRRMMRSKATLIITEYRSFISLFKIIPQYFIPFDAIINEIVFLLWLSDSPQCIKMQLIFV